MSANAWLLSLGNDIRVAVGERELMHIVSEDMVRAFIPCAPAHVSEVIAWQNRLIPLFDVAIALDASAPSDKTLPDKDEIIIAIAAYQRSNNSRVEFGALAMRGLPERVEVSDDSVCAVPSDSEAWGWLAHSCYLHVQYGPVPILDLRRMFSLNDAGESGMRRNTMH